MSVSAELVPAGGRASTWLGGCLPAEVAVAELVGDDDSPPFLLLPEEEEDLGWAVDARRHDFTVGRACAKAALGLLGAPPTAVRRGARREPLWPAGLVGSITHCRGYGAAAAARRTSYEAVGIDAEPHRPIPPEVELRVTSAAERAQVENLAPAGVYWTTLMFSAKESIYKAWYPLTRRWLGFRDVTLTIEPNGIFRGDVLVEAPVGHGVSSQRFDGRYRIGHDMVFTAVVVPSWA